MDLDPGTARFFGYTVEQVQAMPDSHYDGDKRARGAGAHGMREESSRLTRSRLAANERGPAPDKISVAARPWPVILSA